MDIQVMVKDILLIIDMTRDKLDLMINNIDHKDQVHKDQVHKDQVVKDKVHMHMKRIDKIEEMLMRSRMKEEKGYNNNPRLNKN